MADAEKLEVKAKTKAEMIQEIKSKEFINQTDVVRLMGIGPVKAQKNMKRAADLIEQQGMLVMKRTVKISEEKKIEVIDRLPTKIFCQMYSIPLDSNYDT